MGSFRSLKKKSNSAILLQASEPMAYDADNQAFLMSLDLL